MIRLTDLKKGDIFKFGDKNWDEEHRFHSLSQRENGWYDIFFMGNSFEGNIEKAYFHSFTLRKENVQIFIPVYLLCEHRKTKGIPCIPQGSHRILLANNLNEINKSNVYCEGKDYWHNRYQILS